MVAFFKRPSPEETLDARIALLSRRAQPLPAATNGALAPAVSPPDDIPLELVPDAIAEPIADTTLIPPAPATPAATSELSVEDRLLLAQEELFTRLTTELSAER